MSGNCISISNLLQIRWGAYRFDLNDIQKLAEKYCFGLYVKPLDLMLDCKVTLPFNPVTTNFWPQDYLSIINAFYDSFPDVKKDNYKIEIHLVDSGFYTMDEFFKDLKKHPFLFDIKGDGEFARLAAIKEATCVYNIPSLFKGTIDNFFSHNKISGNITFGIQRMIKWNIKTVHSFPSPDQYFAVMSFNFPKPFDTKQIYVFEDQIIDFEKSQEFSKLISRQNKKYKSTYLIVDGKNIFPIFERNKLT